MYQPAIKSRYPIRKPVAMPGMFDLGTGLHQIAQLIAQLESAKRKFEGETVAARERFARETEAVVQKAEKEMQRIAQIQRGTPGRDGKDADEERIIREIRSRIHIPQDGKTPTKEELTALIVPLIPKIRDGEDGKSAEPKEVFEMFLEYLAEHPEFLKNKFSIKDIEGLEETVRRYSIQFAAPSMRGGQGSWKVKNLSGSINSSNKAFTARGDKPAENSEHVMLNYLEQNPLADYTLTYSNGTITVTYTTAPDSSLSGLPHYIRYM